MNRYLFFYDGDCSFCSNLVNKLEYYNTNKELKFESFRIFTDDELLEFHPELNYSKLESEVQLIYDGKRFPGFFAIRKILPMLKVWRYFTLILYLPFVPFIGMAVMYFLRRWKS